MCSSDLLRERPRHRLDRVASEAPQGRDAQVPVHEHVLLAVRDHDDRHLLADLSERGVQALLPGGIRVDEETEESGLDLTQHSEVGYSLVSN